MIRELNYNITTNHTVKYCDRILVLNHDSISDHVTSLGTSFATQPFLTNIYEQHEVDQVEPSSATPGKDRPQHGTQRRQMLPRE